MTEDEHRAAFEAWATTTYAYDTARWEYAIVDRDIEAGDYVTGEMQMGWLAWQEAIRQAEQRHATPPASPGA